MTLINFNPLPSCEGRPSTRLWRGSMRWHFNPLPSCEGRPLRSETEAKQLSFQSTPLMRGETRQGRPCDLATLISIHSPHARGDACPCRGSACRRISIHSPHARGDYFWSIYGFAADISIHSPHARGDRLSRRVQAKFCISIHSPHARGDIRPYMGGITLLISIHSPHARGDNHAVRASRSFH